MKSLSISVLLGISIIVYSAQLFCANYNEQKTNKLKNYLTRLVKRVRIANIPPSPEELSATVKECVEQGANPNIADSINGSRAIHFAAEAGDISLIDFLLLHGVDIESKTSEHLTPLHWAAWNGHYELVTRLIALGANIEAKSDNNRTPLDFAAAYDRTKIVAQLIRLGADIEARNHEGWTPLMVAALYGHQNVVAQLVSLGANVEACAKNDSVLYFAASHDEEMLVKLLSLGAKFTHCTHSLAARLHSACFSTCLPPFPDETELHKAIRLGDLSIATEPWKDVINQRNACDLTALNIALLKRSSEHMILSLLSHGADPLLGRINNLMLASRVPEWQTPRTSDEKQRSIYIQIYDVVRNPYLLELFLSAPDIPAELMLLIVDWMFVPWTIR